MTELTRGQELMLEIYDAVKCDYPVIVFVLGRRSGKGVMEGEIIVRHIRRLLNLATDDSGMDGDVFILHLSESREQRKVFSTELEKIIAGEFGTGFRVGSENGQFCIRLHQETALINMHDVRGRSLSSRDLDITVRCDLFKSDLLPGAPTPCLRIYDEFKLPLETIPPLPGGMTIVFRSEYEASDSRPGVLVIQADREDLHPKHNA